MGCISTSQSKALSNCELVRIDGIDGCELLSSNMKQLIAPSARRDWSAGAIGIGLSHLLCWRLCCAKVLTYGSSGG